MGNGLTTKRDEATAGTAGAVTTTSELSANGGVKKSKTAGNAEQSLASSDDGSVTAPCGARGLSFNRRFSEAGEDPLDQVPYAKRNSVIANPDGSVVFQLDDAEVPEAFSQLATDIVVSKYFRKTGVPETGHEVSVRQVVHRLAHSIRKSGERQGGYFQSEADADTFEAELSYLLVHQFGAFNSPAWFNCGLAEEYGIYGRAVGNFFFDPEAKKVVETKDSYTNPQISACFIQSIEDDLMDIAGAVQREMRLFKFGSGTGTNFSTIRAEGEPLSAGGTSSGLMSFLEILDKAAGATKSGGTTRRAAKMCVLDADHPDIVRFIEWKMREEEKARILIELGGLPADFNGEAYRTVSGQNSNNSVRLTDEFMHAVETDGDWQTFWRTSGDPAHSLKAADVWHKLAMASWSCADPGIQFDTTINAWHTCPNTARINASNPCSEYMFLDDSACNLASLNLIKFLDTNDDLDVEMFRHAVRVFTTAMDIIVDYASYPTEPIAKNSHDYRPLGLGFANLGTMLMVKGVPYDSDEARAIAGSIASIMCGRAYAVSAEIAASTGPFEGFERNREPMLRVMSKHRKSAYEIDQASAPTALARAARADWDLAVALGSMHGYKNSQTTVIAPTGTIGLLMDCDTTGIEPDFALVKWKKLAGGGYFKIANNSVPRALRQLGYTDAQVADIIAYATGTMSLGEGTPHVNRESLRAKGLNDVEIDRIEAALPSAFEIGHGFNLGTIGEEAFTRLGLSKETSGSVLLETLGYTNDQIAEANEVVCGRMTVEGAPHLKDEHLPIFDCANRCGNGERFLAPMAHVKMMAAVQPFISGSISKTVNLPNEATVDEIADIHMEAWQQGLKCIAIYRDGSKASQPLSSSSKTKTDDDEGEKTEAVAEVVEAPLQTSPSAATFQPVRRRMPKKRTGFTQEARIGPQKVYIRTGEYEDGTLGEIFIDVAKEGSSYRSLVNCFAIAVSLGLQYGVPLKEFVNMFTFTSFEPAGITDHPNIKMASSVVDFLFRMLGMEYLGRTDLAHVEPELDTLQHRRREIQSEVERILGDMKLTGGSSTGEGTSDGGTPPIAGTTPDPTGPLATLVEKVNGKNGNGNGQSQPETGTLEVSLTETLTETLTVSETGSGSQSNNRLSVLNEHMQEMMGDAPFCDTCGHITVRNGACYKCLNCGASIGCS